MTNQLEALITSEIADFFACFVEIHTELGGPNTIEEAQEQLTERVTRIASECESALIAALEQSKRANAAQDDHINQQQDRIEQLEKGHQEAAKHITSWRRLAKQNIAEREKDIAELDAARKRIAELEASKLAVKLPQRLSPEGYHIDEAYLVPDAEGDYLARDEVIAVLTAAGIAVQGEE